MKRNLFLLLVVLQLVVQNAVNAAIKVKSGPQDNPSQLMKVSPQVYFEENMGQVKDQNLLSRPDVLYSGSSEGMDFYIRPDGISLQLNKVVRWKDAETAGSSDVTPGKMKFPEQVDICRVDMNLLGSDKNCVVEHGLPLKGYNNYFNMPDGQQPATMVRKFESLLFRDVWDGVDLFYHARNGYIESEWLLDKAEDFHKISFEIKGAEITVDKGQLIMKTPLGVIREGDLKVLQNNNELDATWVLAKTLDGVRVNFRIKGFDAKKLMKIDPPVRHWGTYYGGSGEEYSGNSCITDDDGNIYISGTTPSSDNIATTGAHQVSFGGGSSDSFLVKFNSDGIIQWATYYGGSNHEYVFGCSVDGNGNVFMSGQTRSHNNIATTGSYQEVISGLTDAFLVKFNSNGVREWGTYYGGLDNDESSYLATDNSGNVIVVGRTYSIDNIATVGAHQSTPGGGPDAFVVKFNTAGVRLWGTYYGGARNESVESCSVDGNGNIFIAGNSNSINNIASTGAHQTTIQNSDYYSDAFLVKFNGNGVREWGTYYGGAYDDIGTSCSPDGNGNVFLTGRTNSGNNIATAGAHQTTLSTNLVNDAFLVKFNSAGIRLWGTYYGGSDEDYGESCSAGADGNVYLAGAAASAQSIATPGSHQPEYGGGFCDAFLAKFTGDGIRMWGTYYGGTDYDWGYACYLYGSNILLFGETISINNIATPGAHQTELYGSFDTFLVKFGDCTTASDAPTGVSASASVILIYPNPANGIVNIQSKKKMDRIIILGLRGEVIKDLNCGQPSISLDMSIIPEGIYVVRIISSESVWEGKMVVQH